MKLLHDVVTWASQGVGMIMLALGLSVFTALLAWIALKGLVIWLTQD